MAAVALLATYPFAVFFSAAYTEGLFLLTLVGAVYHFADELWRAAVWGLACGLTRPNGCFLSVVLGADGARAVWDAARWRAILPPPSGWQCDRAGGCSRRRRRARHAAFSAYIYQLTGNPFQWAAQNVAWGRVYRGLDSLVSDRIDFIANNGLYAYASTQTHRLLLSARGAVRAGGGLAGLSPLRPALRRADPDHVLPPMAAGGLLSMGRVTSVLFPAFLWMGAAVPARHRSRGSRCCAASGICGRDVLHVAAVVLAPASDT